MVKVDEFKNLGSIFQSNRVHNRAEEQSVGWVEWAEGSVWGDLWHNDSSRVEWVEFTFEWFEGGQAEV